MFRNKQLSLKQKFIISAGFGLAIVAGGLYAYWTPGPKLVIHDQTIQNGQLTISQINLPHDGWLVLSATKYEQPTEVVGMARIERGRRKNIGLYVNVLRTTPRVELAVYEDKESPGLFDKSTDQPVMIGGQALKRIFNKQ